MKLIKFIKNNNLQYVELGKWFNVNKLLLFHIINNILFGFLLFLYSTLFSPYLLFSLGTFYRKLFNMYKLLSFSSIKFIWSISDLDDIVETVIANYYGIKLFFYHWTDVSQCFFFERSFTVYNDLFLWGPINNKHLFRNSLIDNRFSIGCFFSNNYVERNKEVVLKR
tara:strand:+ start:221 stop:721 length:501 start_codon:yes stop_codon:yes gene_type:complete